MIKTHQEALDLQLQYRTQYELELELVCLNSEFDDIQDSLEKAKFLAQEYPQQVILKESEFHERENPYYEVSIYCDNDNKDKFIKIAQDLGLVVDLIHDTKDYY